MNITNSISPNTDPWGTPAGTGAESEHDTVRWSDTLCGNTLNKDVKV